MAIASVPGVLCTATMYDLLRCVIKDGAPLSYDVQIDLSKTYFIEPVGVVILSNLVEWLRKRHVDVTHVNCDRSKQAVAYLDDVGFFSAYWGNPLSPLAHVRETTYPFSRLMCADSHQWIDGQVFPWLANKLNVHPSTLYEFKTSVRELFNNIADHSTEQVGCMHVQWFPNAHRVKIAVSDFGIGIPASVRKAANPASDFAALALATTEGFSSKPGKNKGAGLSYLIDNVVKRNKGWVHIHSGAGYINFNPVTYLGSGGLANGLYPGTLASMILRTDNLVADEGEADETLW